MATIKELVDKYESWESIPDSEKPSDSKQLDKMKKAFEKGKSVLSAMAGAKDNVLKNSSAGITNDKGDSSLKGNPGAVKVVQKADEIGLKPNTEDTQNLIKSFREAAREALKQMDGKDEKEQGKMADRLIKPAEGKDGNSLDSGIVSIENPVKDIEIVDDEEEKTLTPEESKQNSFLKSWAATHPSWAKILTSKDLSFGQKVQLVGSALANIGANVTLGAKAGFEHSGFQPIDWDFKKAIDKYTSNEIDSVLAGEQKNRAKAESAEFWEDYRKVHGEEATNELIAMLDLYGDNPDMLKSRLSAMGINKSAEEIKDLYANLEKTNLSESAKQKVLETEGKRLANDLSIIEKGIKENQWKLSKDTIEGLIEAQNAMNNFTKVKNKSDAKTYNLEKVAGYIQNVVHEVEAAVGSIVGIRDGIVKGDGTPQKIVKADGTEIWLDPDDNIYATKNEITTEKDNGAEVVPMCQTDCITVQKKLGFTGGFINKDFDYYLSKLRG